MQLEDFVYKTNVRNLPGRNQLVNIRDEPYVTTVSQSAGTAQVILPAPPVSFIRRWSWLTVNASVLAAGDQVNFIYNSGAAAGDQILWYLTGIADSGQLPIIGGRHF